MANGEPARRITGIREERLTQREAAGLLEIDQPNVSTNGWGRLGDFSLERLRTLVNRLEMEIDITMSPNPELSPSSRLVVRSTDEVLAASKEEVHLNRARFDKRIGPIRRCYPRLAACIWERLRSLARSSAVK